jgi:hypothetical protein
LARPALRGCWRACWRRDCIPCVGGVRARSPMGSCGPDGLERALPLGPPLSPPDSGRRCPLSYLHRSPPWRCPRAFSDVSVCAWPLALERLVLGLPVDRPWIPATEYCSSPGCGPDLCSSTPTELALVRLALPLCRSSPMPVSSPPIHVALMPLSPFSPMCVVPMSPLSKVASLLPVVSDMSPTYL